MKRHPGRAWRRWRSELAKQRVQRPDFYTGPLFNDGSLWYQTPTGTHLLRLIGISAQTRRRCSCYLCKKHGGVRDWPGRRHVRKALDRLEYTRSLPDVSNGLNLTETAAQLGGGWDPPETP